MADYCDFMFTWDCDKDPTYVIDYFLECEEQDADLDSSSFPTKLEIYNSTNDDSANNPCQLTVQCKSLYHVGIKGIRFVSESRNVEVYGETEGYIQTVRGKSVPHSEEDVRLFMSDFSTQEPALCLTFKFLSLKGRLSFEMKRIQITLTQMAPPEETSQMDIGKLRSHVKELGDKVSDKAKSLLDTMEQYQKNQRGTLDNMRSMISQSSLSPDKESSLSGMAGLLSAFSHMGQRTPQNSGRLIVSSNGDGDQDDPRSLAGNLLSQMSSGQNGETMHSEDMYKFLHSVCGKVSKFRHTKTEDKKAEEPNKTSEKVTTPTESAVMEEVNKRIQAAEERITNHLETRLSEMETRLNRKMDKILQLLTPDEEEAKPWEEDCEEGPETTDRIPQAIELD